MKKLKTALFNITVYTMLVWSILSATYLALPVEIQAMLPQMNWLTAVVSGGSTALIGTGGLVVRSWLDNARKVSDDKLNLFAANIMQLRESYNTVATKYDELTAATNYNNQLLAVELRTKLTNPMITDAARTLITEVLNHDSQK